MHLAAARLLGRELDDLAEPLQHPYRCLSYLREHGIGQASDEQRNSHRHLINSATLMCSARLVVRQWESPCDQGSELGKLSLHETCRPSLDQHITDSGRLHRTSQHPATSAVGRQLAEQRVLAAATRQCAPC